MQQQSIKSSPWHIGDCFPENGIKLVMHTLLVEPRGQINDAKKSIRHLVVYTHYESNKYHLPPLNEMGC